VARHERDASRVSIMRRDRTRRPTCWPLNAAIEAARAGEHGKGFAVVRGGSPASSPNAARRRRVKSINFPAATVKVIRKKAGEMLSKLVPDIQRTAELVQGKSPPPARNKTPAQSQIKQGIGAARKGSFSKMLRHRKRWLRPRRELTSRCPNNWSAALAFFPHRGRGHTTMRAAAPKPIKHGGYFAGRGIQGQGIPCRPPRKRWQPRPAPESL